MGRNQKNHKPIDDTFDNVLENILKVPVENKRVKPKDDKKNNIHNGKGKK